METRLKVYLNTGDATQDDYVIVPGYSDAPDREMNNLPRIDHTPVLYEDWEVETFAFGQPDKASFTLYDRTGTLDLRTLSYQRVYLELWDPDVDSLGAYTSHIRRSNHRD